MSDEGFRRLWGPHRGTPASPSSSPASSYDRRDATPLDDVRRAVAEIEALGSGLVTEERIPLCEEGGLGKLVAKHNIELGDGFYLQGFGGGALPDDVEGEARPVRHQLQASDEAPMGMLFLYYSPDAAQGRFAELWVPDRPPAEP